MPFKSTNNVNLNRSLKYYINSWSGNTSGGGSSVIYRNLPFNYGTYDRYRQYEMHMELIPYKPVFLNSLERGAPLVGESVTFTIGTLPPEIVYDFENGMSSDWIQTTNFNLIDDSGNTVAGDNVGNTIDAVLDLTAFPDGAKIASLVFYWKEQSGANGFTVELRDSNQQALFQLGGNNPQWELYDADGSYTPFGGDGYDRWIKYEIIFDWSNSLYTYDFRDLTGGTQKTGTRTMFIATNFKYLAINNSNSNWGRADKIVFDDFTFRSY